MAGMSTDDTKAASLDPEVKVVKDAIRECQMVAVYDSNNAAHLARDALTAAGIPPGAIHVIDRHDPNPAGSRSTPESRRIALLGAFSSLFSRAEDPGQFNLVADPNHAVVVLSHEAGVDQERARQILSSCSAIEIYER